LSEEIIRGEDLEDFERCCEEAKAILGIDVEKIIGDALKSKCTHFHLIFTAGEFEVDCYYHSFTGEIKIEFTSERGSRKFKHKVRRSLLEKFFELFRR